MNKLGISFYKTLLKFFTQETQFIVCNGKYLPMFYIEAALWKMFHLINITLAVGKRHIKSSPKKPTVFDL